MKKLFIAIAAIVMCFSMTLTSFAAVTSFMQFFDENTGYVYLFGKFDEGDTAAGFEVDGTAYLLDNEEEDEQGKTAFDRANEGRRMFGIGLIDKFNLLNSTYTATPYSLNASGTAVRGTAVTVNNPELSNNYLSDIQIDGESIPGFDPEKDHYYVSVNSESDISVNSFTVTTATEYASASVAKSGSDYVITSSAPDAEERRTTITILTNKTYQENESVTASAYKQIAAEATTPEVVTLSEGESYAAVRFDISGLVSINDRAKITISAARNKSYDTVLKIYGTSSEGALETASASAKIGESELFLYAEQDEENPVYTTRTFDITDYLTSKIINGDTTATFVIEIEGEGDVCINNLSDISIDFTDWKGALQTLTINGKAFSSFYTGTLETDFWYGLDELPANASGLPAVTAAPVEGTTSVNIIPVYKGYEELITVSSQGITRNVTVHFRELSEVTRTVIPNYHYVAFYNYPDGARSNDLTKQRSIYIKRDATMKSNTFCEYIPYMVPEVEGYSPVAYDLKGIRYYSAEDGISSYAYNGNLNEFTPVAFGSTSNSSTNEYKTVYKYLCPGFKGLDLSADGTEIAASASEFLLADITASKQNYSESAIAFSSTSVKEGANFIIYVSDNTTGQSQYIIADNTNYRMPITVKYVEKYPVDPSEHNANLSSLSINGNPLPEFNANTTEYYYGVENAEAPNLYITAVADYAGATVEVVLDNENSQYEITVTAQDGTTTKTYYVKYREIQTLNDISYTAVKASNNKWRPNGIPNWFGTTLNQYIVMDNSSTELYVSYKLNVEGTIKLVSATYNDSYIRGAATNACLQVDESGNDASNDTFTVYQNNKNMSENMYNFETDTFGTLGSAVSGEKTLGSYNVTTADRTTPKASGIGTSTYSIYRVSPISLDISKMELYNENIIILYIRQNSDISCSYAPKTLSVQYIICD